jgi:hypothetical protein
MLRFDALPKEVSMDRNKSADEGPPNPRQAEVDRTREAASKQPNPPRTTSGGITAPKFGSAGSGGAELEPGLDKN